MADIRHRVGIAAPAERVYGAVATIEGLAQWWTRDVDGDSGPGGSLRFFFGQPEPAAVMEVVKATPSRSVSWRCLEGPDSWIGSELTFEVQPGEGETVLRFTHSWRAAEDFMYHCSTKWGYFLLGLKAWQEGGKGTPFPEDAPISSWG